MDSSREAIPQEKEDDQALLGEAMNCDGRAPDVDLLIRTGGERRLSDFLLWECAYAELHFTPTMWPDFRGHDLQAALHDFSVRQEMDTVFGRFKAGQLKVVAIAQSIPRLWSRVRLMYSNVIVVNNKARLDLVLNAPEDFLNQSLMDNFYRKMQRRAKDFGMKSLDVSVSVIPNRDYKFNSLKVN